MDSRDYRIEFASRCIEFIAWVSLVIRCFDGNYRLSTMTKSGLDFAYRGVDLFAGNHRLQVLDQIEFSYLVEFPLQGPTIPAP